MPVPWDRSLSRLQLSPLAASRRYPRTLSDILHIVHLLHLIISTTLILRCIILVITLPSPTGRNNWGEKQIEIGATMFWSFVLEFSRNQKKCLKRVLCLSNKTGQIKIFTREVPEALKRMQKNICVPEFVFYYLSFFVLHYPHCYPAVDIMIISSYQELLITLLCTLYWSHKSISIKCRGPIIRLVIFC